MIALLLGATTPQAAPHWVPIGVSQSRLHLFVDQNSLKPSGTLIDATIRMGSPTSVTGKVVLVYQYEEFDCTARRWRLTGYEGVDASGAVIVRSSHKASAPPLLPVENGSMGEENLETVCFLAKQHKSG